MKTIIDEIQARRDAVVWSAIPARQKDIEAHIDRTTLLSILAEIGALPDKWEEDAGDRYPIDASGCAHSLEAILKRTQAGT